MPPKNRGGRAKPFKGKSSAEPMVVEDSLPPGSNPNLNNAMVSKKYRPQSEDSFGSSIHSAFECIDPLATAVPPSQSDLYDYRRPSSTVIGKVTYRKSFIQDLVDLMSQIFEQGLNHTLIPTPQDPDHLCEFLVYFGFAAQGYKTLNVTKQQGPIYKLKALLHMDIAIPTFISNLLSNLGSFESKEGIIAVRLMSQLVPNYAILCVKHWNRIPGQYQVPDINVVGQNARRPFDLRFGFWNSVTVMDDLHAYMEMYFPDTLTSVSIANGNADNMPANTTVEIKWDEIDAANGQSYLALLNNAALTPMNAVLRARRIAYVTLRMLDFSQWAAQVQELQTLNIYIGDTDNNPSLREIVDIIGLISGYYASSSLSLSLAHCFQCETFQGATMGTTAQFVHTEGVDTIPPYGASLAHPHHISRSSQSFGVLLAPSKKVEVTPEYGMHATQSRQSMMAKYASNFLTPDK